MPTLTRLIFILLIIGFLIYGTMWGLVLFVRPVTADLTIEIAPETVELKPWPDPTR